MAHGHNGGRVSNIGGRVSNIGHGYNDTSSSDTGWGHSSHGGGHGHHHLGMGVVMLVLSFPKLSRFLGLAFIAYLLNPF